MARLQLDLSDTSDALIERLMELCDLKTKKDVVENALMLLGWAAAKVSEGHSIAAVDKNRKIFSEIQTSALEGAAYYPDRIQKASRKAVGSSHTSLKTI